MDSDFGDVLRPERSARRDQPDRVERGVIAADAGIEFKRDPPGFEALAEARGELSQIEAIVRARERGAEAPIGALEYVNDPGEPCLCEQRAVEPALRRPARVHTLDHGAVLRRHQ